MHQPHDNPDADISAIDRALAGELHGPEAAAFAARLRSEPALRAAFEREQTLAATLKRNVPGPDKALAAAQIAAALAKIDITTTLPWYATAKGKLAAAVVVASVLAAATVLVINARSQPGVRTPSDAVVSAAAENFLPTFAETDPLALESTIAEKIGVRVRLPRGTSYAYQGIRTNVGESPVGIAIVAKVGDRRALLVIDRSMSGNATEPVTPAGLYRHTRTLRSVRVTEYSESPSPLFVALTEN